MYGYTRERLHEFSTSFCIADESDPTHQWNVELDQYSLDDSVRVIYSDYSGADGRVLGELKFQEIRLECTEPECVAQVSMHAVHDNYAASDLICVCRLRICLQHQSTAVEGVLVEIKV